MKPLLPNHFQSIQPYLRWAVGVLLLAGLSLLIYLNRSTCVLIAISFFVAYIFNPLIERLEKRGFSRFTSIWLLVFFSLLILVFIFLIAVPEIQDQTRDVMTKAPGWWSGIEQRIRTYFEGKVKPTLISWNLSTGEDLFDKERIKQHALNVWNWIRVHSEQIVGTLSSTFQSIFSGVTNFIIGILNIIMFPVFTYYFMRDYHKIAQGFYRLFPPDWRLEMQNWMGEIDDVLGRFLRGQFTIAATLALIYSIGLSILGIPMGIVLGMMAGIANMVPYMSVVVGLIPAMLFSLMDSPNLWRLVWILLLFIGGQMLEGLYLSPKIMGGEVGLHPIVVIVAIIVGGTLFGLAGLILAVPVTAVLKVILTRWHESWRAGWESTGGQS